MNKQIDAAMRRDLVLQGQIEALTMLMSQLVAHQALLEAKYDDIHDAPNAVERLCAVMEPTRVDGPEGEALSEGFYRILNRVEGFALPRVRV